MMRRAYQRMMRRTRQVLTPAAQRTLTRGVAAAVLLTAVAVPAMHMQKQSLLAEAAAHNSDVACASAAAKGANAIAEVPAVMSQEMRMYISENANVYCFVWLERAALTLSNEKPKTQKLPPPLTHVSSTRNPCQPQPGTAACSMLVPPGERD